MFLPSFLLTSFRFRLFCSLVLLAFYAKHPFVERFLLELWVERVLASYNSWSLMWLLFGSQGFLIVDKKPSLFLHDFPESKNSTSPTIVDIPLENKKPQYCCNSFMKSVWLFTIDTRAYKRNYDFGNETLKLSQLWSIKQVRQWIMNC